jgi:hypothetical protein
MAKGYHTGGRKKGTPNRATAATRAQLEAIADPLAFLARVMNGELIASALLKDGATATEILPTLDQRIAAGKILADKLVPNAKERPVAFICPPIAATADLLPALGAVMEAMSRGDITPSEATSIAAIIEQRRKAIETVELDARIRALEERQGERA